MVLTNVIQSLSQTGIPRRRFREFEAHNLYDLLKYEQKDFSSKAKNAGVGIN